MKKLLWMLPVILCLSGCASGNKALEEGLSFRDSLLSGNGCSFSLKITADYTDNLHSFAMDCQADPEGNVSFRVTAPESISDIEGNLSYDGGSLDFGDTALHFEMLTDDQLTPVSAPWVLLRTLRGGYIASACFEEKLLRLTVDDSYEEDALRLDVWLEKQTPVRADVMYDGRRILVLDVEDFVIL